MSKPIFINIALRLQSDSGGKGGNDTGDKRLGGLAYSGDAVVQWGERFVIDLETLETSTPLALLFQHRHSQSVGVIEQIANDGRKLAIEEGRLFAGIESDPLPRQIAEKAARGFPYELSVGVYDATTERVPEGKSVAVNGRRFQGPITVIRNGVLREISVVSLGADANTQADIAAQAQADLSTQEDKTMPDPHQGAGGDHPAGDNAQLVELTSRVAELQQQLDAAKQRADQAEQTLAEFRKKVRLSDVKRLLSDIGVEYSEEAAKPYMELSDDAFSAMAEQVRARLKAAASDGGALFSDAPADGADKGDATGNQLSLSVTEIYAKRRNV